jgi:hypothetical protein
MYQLRTYKVYVFFVLDLSQRVDAVKDENLKLKSENQVKLAVVGKSVCCFCNFSIYFLLLRGGYVFFVRVCMNSVCVSVCVYVFFNRIT